jgi:hypothetical protein
MQVIIDRNRRSAIITRQGQKYVHLVQLSEGELTTSRLTDEELDGRGFRPLAGYPLDRAVNLYLNHNGGVSDAARRELLNLLEA